MITKWAHLLNAKYIDAVIASIETHPDKWSWARRKAYPDGNGRGMAWDAVEAVREAARDEAWSAARVVAWDAILALIAYDDCAHLLTSNPEEVKLLAKLGQPAAVLLYPASLVFNETNELTLV